MNELIQLAKTTAVAHGLQPEIVCAVVEQESSWKPNSTRFEPLFLARYVKPQGIQEPEATQRATSWGLMQLMGEVAREFGYTGLIPDLEQPPVGLEWGCKKLKSCFNLAYAKGHEDDPSYNPVHAALEHWNGGGNPNYASEVMARIHKYVDNPSDQTR